MKKKDEILALMGMTSTFTPLKKMNGHRKSKQEKKKKEPITLATLPITSTHGDSLPLFFKDRNVARTRSLQDLYEITERLDNLILFCLFADYEPVNFYEAVQDEKWKVVMDEEIKTIMKNNT